MIQNLKLTLCAAFTAAFLFPVALCAGTQTTSALKTVVEPARDSIFSGDLGVNFVSKYIARGVVLENEGVIAQPYADAWVRVYKDDGFINQVKLGVGLWGSLHSAKTGASKSSNVPVWFEQDFTANVQVTFAKRFTLTTAYCWFDSPNGAFRMPRALNVRLDLNDTDWLGAFALHPHVTYLRELENKVANGRDQGNYYEIGIAPALPCCGPVVVSFPMSVGFGSNEFYAGNEAFGYYSGGINLAVPVACIPAQYGAWTFNTGVSYLYIHGDVAAPNAIRGTGHNDIVFNGGIGAVF